MADRRSELDLHQLLRILRRRKWVILLVTVVVPVAALGYSLSQAKQYQSTATLLFRDPQLEQQLTGSLSVQPLEDPARTAATNIGLVELGTVARQTARDLHRPIGSVSVSGNATTDLVSVTATSTSPAFAAKVANTYANEYILFRRDQDVATIASVRNLIQNQYQALPSSRRQTSQAKALASTSNRLNVLSSLQTGNAQLVQPAKVPSSPSSPKPLRNTIFGLVIGLVVGLALAILLDLLDRRVREPNEIEEIFGRPVLSAVPEMRELRSEKTAEEAHEHSQAAEVFQMLRANLRYFNVDTQVKLVLVTSAVPGEGKTTVAWNLAVASARAGMRVLIIEADLRRPAIAQRHGLHSTHGLSTLLAGHEKLSNAVQHVRVHRFAEGADPANLATVDVLPAGAKPPNPADLLESRRMAQLLEDAKDAYDLVVVDTPPATVVSDAVPLIRLVDGVLVVSRLRKVARESVVHLQKQLERLNAPVIGVVVNGLYGDEAGGYGYGYYYQDGRDYLSSGGGAGDSGDSDEQPISANGADTNGLGPRETVEGVVNARGDGQ